jgi:hypothetical protein
VCNPEKHTCPQANATNDDRHELLDFIRHATKPKKMKVQAFYIWLRELNQMVGLLPGAEAPLTNAQLIQAFHDGMPETWIRYYRQLGRNLQSDTPAQCLQFFHSQQANSDRAEYRNEKKNKAMQKKRRNGDETEDSKPRGRTWNKWRRDSKHRLSHQQDKKEGRNKKIKENKAVGNRIADSDPCPIHPGSSHTWGECFLNARNKKPSGNKKPYKVNSKFKPKGKSKNDDDVDANAMHCSKCDDRTESSHSSGEESSSDEGSYETRMKDAVNDVDMSEDIDLEFDDNGYDLAMAKFVDEANSTTSHPTNYVAEHKECMQARLEKPMTPLLLKQVCLRFT